MRNFTKYAWFVVAYNVLVILWGAMVRATGSGAGCGRHWPLCNGEAIHRPESVETMIELSHRLTSTLAGFFVIILVVWAFRAFEKGSLVRRAAVWSLIFIIIEGGLGAGLVLLELVEDNASVWRALAVSVHLLNTFVLLMWLVLTAWASRAPSDVRLGRSPLVSLMIFGLVWMAILSSMGAVTALGDTLFLSGSLARQFGEESAAEHFLVQLRVIHPMLAVVVSLLLFWIGRQLLSSNPDEVVKRLIYIVFGVIVLQTLLGLFTIILRAPIFMQMSHLLLADVLWITLLLLTFEMMARAHAPASQPIGKPAESVS